LLEGKAAKRKSKKLAFLPIIRAGAPSRAPLKAGCGSAFL